MQSLKIYLDTSVVSMLDNSSRGIITREFFELVTQNNCELVVSEIVENEINDIKETKQPQKEAILYFMEQLKLTKIPRSKESNNLAWIYVIEGVLTHNHIDDLLHVAYATVHQCDMIVSWNRKHIANPSKIQKINFCNINNQYHSITICTPEEFLVHFR